MKCGYQIQVQSPLPVTEKKIKQNLDPGGQYCHIECTPQKSSPKYIDENIYDHVKYKKQTIAAIQQLKGNQATVYHLTLGQAAHLCIGRIVDVQELIHGPVEPAHQEDAQCKAVRDEHERRVCCVTASVDVPHHVILKDGHAVVHICTRLAVGEAVEEAAET